MATRAPPHRPRCREHRPRRARGRRFHLPLHALRRRRRRYLFHHLPLRHVARVARRRRRRPDGRRLRQGAAVEHGRLLGRALWRRRFRHRRRHPLKRARIRQPHRARLLAPCRASAAPTARHLRPLRQRSTSPAALLPCQRMPCAGTPGGNPPDPHLARHEPRSAQHLTPHARSSPHRSYTALAPSATATAAGHRDALPATSQRVRRVLGNRQAPRSNPRPAASLVHLSWLAERLRGRAGRRGRRRRSGTITLAAAAARPRRRCAAAEHTQTAAAHPPRQERAQNHLHSHPVPALALAAPPCARMRPGLPSPSAAPRAARRRRRPGPAPTFRSGTSARARRRARATRPTDVALRTRRSRRTVLGDAPRASRPRRRLPHLPCTKPEPPRRDNTRADARLAATGPPDRPRPPRRSLRAPRAHAPFLHATRSSFLQPAALPPLTSVRCSRHRLIARSSPRQWAARRSPSPTPAAGRRSTRRSA